MMTRRRFLCSASLAAFSLSAASRPSPAQEILTDHFMGMAGSDYIRYARLGPHRVSQNPTLSRIGENSEDANEIAVVRPRDMADPGLIVFSHGAVTEPLLYRYLF